MSSVTIPIKNIAHIAHQNAKQDDFVQIQGIQDESLAKTLSKIATTELVENVETGEYVGKSTVQIEGTIEKSGVLIDFEITYWFENTGQAKIRFQKR